MAWADLDYLAPTNIFILYFLLKNVVLKISEMEHFL